MYTTENSHHVKVISIDYDFEGCVAASTASKKAIATISASKKNIRSLNTFSGVLAKKALRSLRY